MILISVPIRGLVLSSIPIWGLILILVPILSLVLISVPIWGRVDNQIGAGALLINTELLFLISVPTWAWIGIYTGILFVLGSLTICIFRSKICKLTNSLTGKMRLKKTTDLQEVALLGKCDMEKVGQHVYITLLIG